MAIRAHLPDGRVLNFPDGTAQSVIQATVKRLLAPAAEPTLGGQVKEAFKGLVPGAVGMVEQAAIGASALLPDEYEPAVRKGIADVAGAAKAPFAAAPGYEQTVGRKLGEAGGSILPMLAAAPFGLPGVAAGAALGIGAGAGEARTRAEQAKATDEERAAATALGTLPGALEVFAPLRIIKRLPDEVVGGAVQYVKRALLAGGEEAAQEAASGFAQNLIAKGIYKPEQELIEGLGEQAAYGGAVGAIAQGVLDLALGRRARGAGAQEQPTETEQAELEAQRAREAARLEPKQVPTEAPAEATYAELVQARERLRQEEQTPETKAATKALDERIRLLTLPEAERAVAQVEQAKRGEELAAQSAFASQEPQQMEFGGMGEPGILPVAPEPAPTPAPTQKDLEAAGQQRLPLRRTPAGQPTTSALEELDAFGTVTAPPADADIPEPTLRKKPELIQHPEINEETVSKGTLNWVKTKKGQEFLRSIIGLDPAEAQARRKEFVGRRQLVRGEIFDAIYPEQAPTPAGTDVRPEPAAGQPAAEPSVGVPAPSGPDQTSAELAEPSDGAGVGDLSGPVGTEPVVEGAPAAAVTPTPAPFALDQLLRGATATEPTLETESEADVTPEPAPVAKRPSAFDLPKRSLFDPIREAQEARDEVGGVIYKGDAYGVQAGEVTQPYAADELRAEVSDFVRAPVPERKLKVVDSVEDLLGSRDENEVKVGQALQREGAFGVATNGRAYLVANRIQKGQGRAKFMHEVGAHLGLEGLLPSSLYKRLTNQLKQWAESGANTDEAMLAAQALQRVQAAQTPEADRDAELLAYFVEEAVQAGVNPTATQGGSPLQQWFRALWSAFKVALRKLGMKPETMTAKDVVDLAYGAARLEMAGTFHGTAAQFRNFRNKYIGTGEGATAFGWGTYLAQRAGIAKGYWTADVARKTKPGAAAPEGSFMRVDTAVEDSRMYDYDKPISAQHPEVREKLAATLEPLADEIVDRTNLDVDELTGQDLIGSGERKLGLLSKLIMDDYLQPAQADADFDNAVAQGNFHEAASHYLRTLGLDGIKFLDAKSRGAAPKSLVLNGKEYTRNELVDAAKTDPDGLGRYSATLRNALRSGVESAKDELRARVDDAYRMFVDTAVESAKRFGVPVDPKAIRDRATADARGTYHGEQLAWLEAQDVRVREAAPNRTRNLVIFDDRNIFRVGSAVGADRQRMRFGKEAPKTDADKGKEVTRVVRALGNEPAPDPTAKQKLAAIYDDVRHNPREVVTESTSTARKWWNTFGNNVWSSDFEFQANMRRALEGMKLPTPQIMDFLLRTSTAQASNADALATSAMVNGALKIDGNLIKAVKSDNNMPALAQSFKRVADKYGLTALQTEQAWHTVTEAERLRRILKDEARLTAEAARFEAEGDVGAANKRRELIKKAHRNPQQIAEGLRIYDLMPELRESTKIWNTFKGNIVDFMADTGVMDRKMAEEYIDDATYVPFYRVEQIDNNKGPREYMTGLMVRKDPKFKGSYDKPVNDVFDNVLRWAQYSVEKGVRNHRALTMVKTMQELGWARPVSELPAQLQANPPGEVVTVFEDGKQVKYQTDIPGAMSAFSGLESVSIPALKYFSKIADVLRQSVVLNPVFAVLQVPQDSFAAMFTSGLKPRYALTVPARAVKEFTKTLLNVSKTHKDLKKYGAVGRRDVTSAVRRNDLEAALGLKATPGIRGRVAGVLHHISMASDSAVRQAVYEASIAQGLSKGEAIQKSFDLINFRYRGNSKLMSLAAQTIPFFNAYSAATYVAYKTLTGQGISPTARSEALRVYTQMFAVTAALSLIYAMLIGDDEDYQKTGARERDRSLMIPGTGIGIPLRPDVFLLPKILAEHTYQMMLEDGTTDPAKMRKSITEALVNTVASPTTVPQAVKPLLEVGINYNFFTGRPIVGAFEQNKDAMLQYNEYTSEFSKALSAGLGADVVAPAKLDHFIRGTFGSLGAGAIWATNLIMDPETGGEKADMSWRDMAATFPGLGAVVRNTNEAGLVSDFYELREATRKAHNTYLQFEANMPEMLERYVADPKTEARLQLADAVEDVGQALTEIRQAKQAIRMDPDMSGAEKEEALRELDEARNEILQSVPLKEWRTQAL